MHQKIVAPFVFMTQGFMDHFTQAQPHHAKNTSLNEFAPPFKTQLLKKNAKAYCKTYYSAKVCNEVVI